MFLLEDRTFGTHPLGHLWCGLRFLGWLVFSWKEAPSRCMVTMHVGASINIVYSKLDVAGFSLRYWNNQKEVAKAIIA